MPPMHSPSNIAKADQCPSRLREYRNPPPTYHLVLSKPTDKGIFYHLVVEQWLERLNRAIQVGEWEDFTSFVSRKKARIDQLRENGITVTSGYGELLTKLLDECKIQKYLYSVHKKFTIKIIRTEISLPSKVNGMILQEGFEVKGIVDCIVETEENGFLVIDWKTNLHLKKEDEMMRYSIQLALYAKLAANEYNVDLSDITPRLISLTQSNEKRLPLMARLESTDLATIGDVDRIVHWTSESRISGTHCSTCDEAYALEPCRARSTDETIKTSSQRLHDPMFTSGNTVIDFEIHGNRFKPLSWKSFVVSNGEPENERILHVHFSKARGRVEIPEDCFVRCRGKIKFDDGHRTLTVFDHAILL
jgi:hypothetical protein